MVFKDWYRGLLRFLPKPMTELFSSKDHIKNFPNLNYYDKDTRKEIEKMVGTRINNIAIYEQAFTHRSFQSVLHSENLDVQSNERLEFLGDSVLGLIVSDYLFYFFPDVQEGELTKMRSRLVNKHSLAFVAKNMGLQKFIKISFGTERNFDKAGETIIADTFEALIAAIYFDSGIEKTVAFVYKNVLPLLELDIIMSDTNYKSTLMEFSQRKCKDNPTYKVISTEGPDHDRIYTVGVFLGEELIGIGSGRNKKDAEQIAAKVAIDALTETK